MSKSYRNSYSKITNFGPNEYSPSNNPISYCIGSSDKFLHGSSSVNIEGQQSRQCQLFLSDYCANKWDDYCELASKNASHSYPNNMGSFEITEELLQRGLNAGDMLLYNTAKRKYLKEMINGEQKFEPFDPTVSTSPLISYWVSKNGPGSKTVPVYAVDASTVDQDVLMNKLLDKPIVAIDILVNIINTAKRDGTINTLKGTRLGNYFNL